MNVAGMPGQFGAFNFPNQGNFTGMGMGMGMGPMNNMLNMMDGNWNMNSMGMFLVPEKYVSISLRVNRL